MNTLILSLYAGPQSFEEFMTLFGNTAIMPQNGDPSRLFAENINFMNTQNVLFLEGELTYSLAANSFSALSFEGDNDDDSDDDDVL